MKIEVKSILKNCGLKIKNEQTINKIIWALKGRFEKYNNVGISRKEFEKFGIKEREMYLIIEDLKDLGLISLVGYIKIKKTKFKVCVYKISSVLKQIFGLLSYYIKDFNDKIINFNKGDIEAILNNFGIKTFKNGRLFERNSKITFNKRIGVITNWKEDKHYNLFNYLKEIFGLSSISLYKRIYS